MNQAGRRSMVVGLSGVLALSGVAGALAVMGSTAGALTSSPAAPTSVSFSGRGYAALPHLLGGTTSATAKGAVDFSTKSASVTVEVRGALARRLPGASGAASTLQAVLSGGTLFVSWPGLSTLTHGKAWVSVALPAKAQSRLSARMTRAASAVGDVHAIVAYVTSHHGQVHPLGTRTIDGVKATGYQVSAPLGAGTLARQAKHRAKASGDSGRLSAVLWANAQGQLVRANVHANGARGGHGGAIVDLSGYDAPVAISAPPGSQVLSVPWTTARQYLHLLRGSLAK